MASTLARGAPAEPDAGGALTGRPQAAARTRQKPTANELADRNACNSGEKFIRRPIIAP